MEIPVAAVEAGVPSVWPVELVPWIDPTDIPRGLFAAAAVCPGRLKPAAAELQPNNSL